MAEEKHGITEGAIKQLIQNINDTYERLGYAKEWTTETRTNQWSALCTVAGIAIEGVSFLLNITATRGNMVFNYSFHIATCHPGTADRISITQLGGPIYSNFTLRVYSQSNGYAGIALVENNNSIGTGTKQFVNCRLIALSKNIIISPITTFTEVGNTPTLNKIDFSYSKTLDTKGNVVKAGGFAVQDKTQNDFLTADGGTKNLSEIAGSFVIDNGTISSSSSSDLLNLNNWTSTGIYHSKLTNSTSGVSNYPESNHGTVWYEGNVGTPYQLYIPDASMKYIYKRYCTNNTWSNWFKISAGSSDDLYISDYQWAKFNVVQPNRGSTNAEHSEFIGPGGNATFAIRTTSGGADCGILWLSEDNAYIANSSDNGYCFSIFDTDRASDLSTSANAEFSILSDGGGAKFGKQEVTSLGGSNSKVANRIIITPAYHTGGPWYIKSYDTASDAHLKLFYGTGDLMTIKHTGQTSIIGENHTSSVNSGKYLLYIEQNHSTGGGVGSPAAVFRNTYGTHDYGRVAEFNVSSTSGDRPSIRFSAGNFEGTSRSVDTWSIGYVGNDNKFRISQNHGWDSWGTARLTINTDGNATFSNNVTAAGFHHSSQNSDNYILLAGGGYTDKTKYLMKTHIIDASSLDQNTWYPVTIGVGSDCNTRIEIEVALNSGTKPSWSTHSSGFSVRKIWETNGSGWGTIDVTRNIWVSTYSFAETDPVRGIGQNTMASHEYVYVRGGGKYIFRISEGGGSPVIHPDGYSWNSGRYNFWAPTATTPPEAIVTTLESIKNSSANGYWANQQISLTPSTTTTPTFGGLQVINDNSNYDTNALAYFRHRSNNDWAMILDKGDSYDYGLKISTAQSASHGLEVGGQLIVNSQCGSYREGLRLKAADGQWSTIILGATGDSGTNTNAWSIHRKDDNNFSISRNSSDGANGLVINTSGNVGIGYTSPSYRLHVNGSGHFIKQIKLKGDESTNHATGIIMNASDDTQRAYCGFFGNVDNADYSSTGLRIGTNYGNIRLEPAANIEIAKSILPFNYYYPENGSGTETNLGSTSHEFANVYSRNVRCRHIDGDAVFSNKDLYVGYNTDITYFGKGGHSYVSQAVWSLGKIVIMNGRTDELETIKPHAANFGYVGRENQQFWKMYSTYYYYRNAPTSFSDIRFKTDIKTISYDKKYLDVIDSIPVITFNYTDTKELKEKNNKHLKKLIKEYDYLKSIEMPTLDQIKRKKELRSEICSPSKFKNSRMIGTSAQELEKVLPPEIRSMIVRREKTKRCDDERYVNEVKLIYPIILALKEQKQINEQLQNTVNSLNERLAKLEELLNGNIMK